jgi:hypothetical protein
MPYQAPVIRSGMNDKDRKALLETKLVHSDEKIIGSADYSVEPAIEEMTGKEIAALRKRISDEVARVQGLGNYLLQLDRQIQRTLNPEEED